VCSLRETVLLPTVLSSSVFRDKGKNQAVLAEKEFVAERLKKGMLLFFIDVDDLKGINDTVGHFEGATILASIRLHVSR
jgi:GGDEF domain-containing protein